MARHIDRSIADTESYWDDGFDVEDDVDLESIAMDIAGGVYTATIYAHRFVIENALDSAPDPSFQTRQWLNRHHLQEVNLFADLPPLEKDGLLGLLHIDYLLTASMEEFSACPSPIIPFLLSRPANRSFWAGRRVTSVDQFIEETARRRY
jgi:hypothetical protein